MKKLFVTLVLVLGSIFAHAQSEFFQKDFLSKWYGGLKLDTALWLNTKDTTKWPAANYPGALVYQRISGDTSLYISNGVKYVKVTSDLSAYMKYSDTAAMLIPYLRKADTASLSNRIDSRTLEQTLEAGNTSGIYDVVFPISGFVPGIAWKSGSNFRWQFRSTNEPTSNFQLTRTNDAELTSSVFTVTRSTGVVDFTEVPRRGGNTIWDANNHPEGSAYTPILTGANVFASFATNASGHVTAATTRAITPTDIGAAAFTQLQDSSLAQTLQRVTDKNNRTTQGIGASWLETNTTRVGAGTDGAAVLVLRTFASGTQDARAKAFTDGTIWNRVGSHISFDAYTRKTANKSDTIVSFQSRPEVNATSADTLLKLIGFWSWPSVTGGHVVQNHHIGIRDFQFTGGTIAETVGLNIAPLTKATNNYSIRVEDGGAKSYFGGNIGIKREPSFPLDVFGAINTSSNAGVGGSTITIDPTASTSAYNARIALDNTGMSIGHGSSVRAIYFTINAIERGRFTPAGLFSVNETNPTAQLEVKGTSASSGSAFRVRNLTPNTVFEVSNNGDITIFGGIKLLTGAGSPEGSVTAPPGSFYLRSSGGAGTTFYVKESGSGNTGWVGK